MMTTQVNSTPSSLPCIFGGILRLFGVVSPATSLIQYQYHWFNKSTHSISFLLQEGVLSGFYIFKNITYICIYIYIYDYIRMKMIQQLTNFKLCHVTVVPKSSISDS